MKKLITLVLLLAVLAGLRLPAAGQQPHYVSGTIRAGNFQVYYERQGRGPAVLLVHAGLQDHTMWAEQVRRLSRRYEVVTIDLPYHGLTWGADTVLLAQEVVRIVLDSLRLEQVAIAGLSMGAAVVQDFVIAYPERVEKAILVSAGVNGYEKRRPVDSVTAAWYPKFAKALEAGDTASAAAEFTRAWAEGVYRTGDSLQKQVSRQVYRTTLQNLRVHRAAGWPRLQNHPPAVERLASIKVPVLIIDADKDLPYVAVASNYMVQTIPGARRVVVKGAAHMLNLEKPALFHRLVTRFLKSPGQQ